MSAGKGDSQRRVNGEVYRENFDAINWKSNVIALSNLVFMRSHGFDCANEQDAYELRGLLDM